MVVGSGKKPCFANAISSLQGQMGDIHLFGYRREVVV
jgi:hypothetical protein